MTRLFCLPRLNCQPYFIDSYINLAILGLYGLSMN